MKKWIDFQKLDNCYRARLWEDSDVWIEFNEIDLISANKLVGDNTIRICD